VDLAYTYGWRIRSEVLTLARRHVDLDAGTIRLEPGMAKNDEPREFPLTAELRACLEAQRERTEALQRRIGRIIPWVFHRNGRPIKTMRGA
jgi:integrase